MCLGKHPAGSAGIGKDAPELGKGTKPGAAGNSDHSSFWAIRGRMGASQH